MKRIIFDFEEKYRPLVLFVLLLFCVLLTYYFHAIIHSGVVFSHFFYVPILLSALWWRKKGVWTAVFLAFLLAMSHIFFREGVLTINDYMRAFMFVAIGTVVAFLSENISEERDRNKHLNLVLKAIRNVNKIIVKEADPDILLQKACESLIETRGYRSARISLLSDSRKTKTISQVGECDDFYIPRSSGLFHHEDGLTLCEKDALAGNGIVLVDNPSVKCFNCSYAGIYGDSGIMVMKIFHAGRTYGILSVAVPVHYIYDLEEQDLFLELGNDLAYALHDIELAESKKKADEMLKKQAEDLNKRVKELNCLYSISRIVEKSNLTLDEIVQKITDIIPSAWNYDDITCAKINFDGKEFQTGNYKETEWNLARNIFIEGRNKGYVKICYTESMPLSYYGPFLEEEIQLIDAIAERLGRIIERKQNREELLESEQKLSQIVQGSTIPTFVIDRDHRVTHWNRACEKLTGVDAEEILYSNKHKGIFYPGERPLLADIVLTDNPWDEINKYYKGRFTESELIEGAYEAEDFFPHLGEGRWLFFTAAPIRDTEGNYTGAIETLQDITLRKLVEDEIQKLNRDLENRVEERTAELEAVNKELKDFAYIVSHDLKAPLRAISQLSNWVRQDYNGILDESGNEKLQLIVSRVKRMENLINGILQYSRAGNITERKERVNLNVVVKDIMETISQEKNITIDLKKELPVVPGDRTRINQVFLNLISNAVKFMDKESGEIEIDFSEDNFFWRFSISDNGPGIDEKYHEKIFQIFQTLEPRDELESTGIGLALVKKIIELYGGSIWVESQRGRGSTFYFTIPKKWSRT